MSSTKSFVHAEVSEIDSYALITGSDMPFLSGLLQSKLEDSGCIVHMTKERGVAYDYIITFGTPSDRELEHLLGPSGKAVLLLTHEHVHPISRFPIVSLIQTKHISADTLSASILEQLITSRPMHKELPPPRKPASREHAPPKPKKSHLARKKILKKVFLILLALFILFLPVIIAGSAGAITVTNIKRAANPSLTGNQRETYITTARISSTVLQKTYSIMRPVFSVFTDVTAIGDNVLIILEHTIGALHELNGMEKDVTDNHPALTQENPALFTDILPAVNKRLTSIDSHIQTAQYALLHLAPYRSLWGISALFAHEPDIVQARKAISAVHSLSSFAPTILGQEREKKYLVLLQNNFEIRPTGGFIGSYAIITVKNGGITNFHIEDVYEADGQLKGSVEPPAPIALYLQQPNWFLRDSNWDPDFAVSAKQAEWFLGKELEQDIDGVVAIDLFVIRHLLEITGPLYVPDYQSTVSADDFFVKIQSDTHADFFPGSTKKRDLLNALAHALVVQFTEQQSFPPSAVGQSLFQSLEEKHILLALRDGETQSAIDTLGWGGRIVEPTQETTNLNPYRSDYMMVVDANLGVNKVNYYVQRELFTTTSVSDNAINRETVIYYKNDSPYRASTFSGTYKNYVRILIPKDSAVTSIMVDETVRSLQTDVMVEEIANKKSLGLLVSVDPQHQSKIVLLYTLPLPSKTRFLYQLMVQKQPGTDNDPFVFKIPRTSSWKVIESNIPSIPYLTPLRTDTLITVDFQAGTE